LSRPRPARALRIGPPSAKRGRISIASTCLLFVASRNLHDMPLAAGVCSINDSARPIFSLRVDPLWNEIKPSGFLVKREKGHAALLLPPELRRSHRGGRRRRRIAEPVGRPRRGVGGDP